MSQLGNDSFIRANQSGWGLASDGVNTWAPLGGAGGTYAIATNEGTFTNTLNRAVSCLGTNTAQNAEILGRMSLTASAADMGVCLRGDGTINNYYRARLKGQFLHVTKCIAGVETDLGSVAFTNNANTFYWIRFRVFGSNLMAKAWQDGSAEPGGWLIATSDTSLSAAGRYGIGSILTVVTQTVSYDHVTVTDISTKSLPVRVRMTVQNTQSLVTRLLLRTQKTLSVPIRFVERVTTTRSLPMRLLVRTAKSVSLPVRTLLNVTSTKTLAVRTILRAMTTRTLPVRARVRVQISKSLPVRAIVRNSVTKTLGIRTRFTVSTTRTLGIRVVVLVPQTPHYISVTWITRDGQITWKTRQ